MGERVGMDEKCGTRAEVEETAPGMPQAHGRLMKQKESRRFAPA